MRPQGRSFAHDVVILGGGPAGAAAALSLRQHAPARSVALVEQSSCDAPRVGETLPPTAQSVLQQLDVWERFVGEGHVAAYGTRAAWGSDRVYENEFIYHPAGRDGWLLHTKTEPGNNADIEASFVIDATGRRAAFAAQRGVRKETFDNLVGVSVTFDLASYAVVDHFKGTKTGLEKYEALVAREFKDYLSARADFYGQERCWPDSPFWQRRRNI